MKVEKTCGRKEGSGFFEQINTLNAMLKAIHGIIQTYQLAELNSLWNQQTCLTKL